METGGVEGRDSRWYNQVTNRAERLMTMLRGSMNIKYLKLVTGEELVSEFIENSKYDTEVKLKNL